MITVDADFRLMDGDHTVYEEPTFLVVELARSLSRWLNQSDGNDFVFDSMSFEELGALTVTHATSGWILGSIFTDVVSPPIQWTEVELCVRTFVSKVTADLTEFSIDATEVFRQ